MGSNPVESFFPNLLGHPDNYIPANYLLTPVHIVPEWYFLPMFAVLKAVPGKGLGAIMMIFFIMVFMLMPFVLWFTKVRSFTFRPLQHPLFFLFLFVIFLLGVMGGLPAVYPYNQINLFLTISYFLLFGAIILFSFIENIIYRIYIKKYFSTNK